MAINKLLQMEMEFKDVSTHNFLLKFFHESASHMALIIWLKAVLIFFFMNSRKDTQLKKLITSFNHTGDQIRHTHNR